MNLFVRIILWGLLMLMLNDANSQPRSATDTCIHPTWSAIR